MKSWHHDTDPHEFIPVGYHSERNSYTVVSFCSPSGGGIKRTMVCIKYDGRDTIRDYDTTIRYLAVMRDFAIETSHRDWLSLSER